MVNERRGVTLTEVVIGLCAVTLLAAMTLPALQARRHAAAEAMSMVNLHTLHLAQAADLVPARCCLPTTRAWMSNV